MNAQQIRDLLHRKPFVPFDLVLSNGQVIKVPHPECVVLSKTGMVVAYPDNDQIAIVSYLHIASISTSYPTTAA
jgi:hypothetical protein